MEGKRKQGMEMRTQSTGLVTFPDAQQSYSVVVAATGCFRNEPPDGSRLFLGGTFYRLDDGASESAQTPPIVTHPLADLDQQ